MKRDRIDWIGCVTSRFGLGWRTLLFVLFATTAVPAQQDTIPQRGFHPAGSYALTDLETINTGNGNLMFRIPLVSLPSGRGGAPGPAISVYYNSKLWDTFAWIDRTGPTPREVNEIVQSPDGGWRYALSYELRLDNRLFHDQSGPVNCSNPGSDNILKLKMSFPDGSVREFRPRGFSDFFADGYFNISPDGFGVCGGSLTSPMTYYSTDGSYLKLVIEHDTDNVWSNNPWTLYLNDGRRITGGNAPQRIYDRNANFVEFRNITYNTHPATQIIDQLGRSVIVEYGSAPGQDSVYGWGTGNEQLIWNVHWTTASVSKLYFAYDAVSRTLTRPLSVISEISLPPQAGSLAYAFEYNPAAANPGWGELSLLRLPSGAQATYQYRADGADSIHWRRVIDNAPTRKDLTYLREYDGVSAPTTETWLYSGDSGDEEFTISTPDGGVLRDHISRSGTYWSRGMVYKTEHPDGRLVERLWNRNPPPGVGPNLPANPYVKTEFTSVRDSLGNLAKTAIKDFNYDKNGNLTRLAEYDWVQYSSVPRDTLGRPMGIPPGTQLRKLTLNTYYNPAPDSSSTVDHVNAYYNPSSPPLRSAIESSEVSNELGQTLSRTESFYDNPSATGNLTQERRWDDTKGPLTRPLGSTNSIAVSHQYSASGNRVLTTDARGIQTQFIYGAINGFSDLYVTQTKTAYRTAVQRTTNLQHDFCTGLVSLQTDADNNVTTRTSYDVFGRPTLIQEAYLTALERRTSTEYSDTERRVIVRRDLNTTGDGRLTTVEHYDPLGRIRLRQQLENPTLESAYDETAGIKVQTRYAFAAPNRLELVSNPYRAGSSMGSGDESTMGWTRTTLDGGGRIVEVQTFAGGGLPPPWGANAISTGTVRTSYDANATIVTDQAGKSRRSVSDALGRLTGVTEDPAGQAHLTAYQYDALDNLTMVQQAGQTRSFSYDSLSRLASAINPESGSVGYDYDGNGNLKHKTVVRGTITYNYDELNRVISRSYTDGTPLVTLVYDAPAVTNSKGRLTSVISTVSSYGYDEYDALGRVKRSSQVTDGRQYLFGYAYNLAGGMTSQTYPSGRIITTGYDMAGRISSATGQKAGEAGKAYASSLAYASHGPVRSVRLGNGLWEHTNFNNRLQPIQIGLGATSPSTSLLSLDYSYGATNNNGNVLSQTITATGFSKQQSYSYDALNRLQQADEIGSWSQTYGYDRYGNRWVNPGSYVRDPTLTPQSQSAFDANYNRLLGCQYDPAGNLTQDGTGNTYTYDLENRQKSHNGTTTYHYDGEGRRIKKVEALGATVFIYNAAGQLVHEHSDLPPSETSGTGYLTTDHLGSTRVITDDAGAVKKRYDYLPFGEEIPASVGGRSSVPGYPAADSTRQRFTGKERDHESGLDYLGARYLSGAQGRFTSPDRGGFHQGHVLNPQKWNQYACVLNDPLNLVDPGGMEERRLLSKVLNLYADASRVISIRVGVGPGLKGRVTILGVGFEGGVVGMANLKVFPLNPALISLGISGEAGIRGKVGPLAVKAQAKEEVTLIKDGTVSVGLDNKSGVGGENPVTKTKANTGSGDLTAIGVSTPVWAIGPVPISAEADININSEKLVSAIGEIPGAIQEIRDTAKELIEKMIPRIPTRKPAEERQP